MARFSRYWLPVILCSVVILFFSSLPGEKIPGLFSGQAIVFHITEYFIFAFLFSRAMQAYYPNQTKLTRLLLIFFFVLCFGIFDELYQSFIPNRSSDLFDVMIDAAGGFLGSLF